MENRGFQTFLTVFVVAALTNIPLASAQNVTSQYSDQTDRVNEYLTDTSVKIHTSKERVKAHESTLSKPTEGAAPRHKTTSNTQGVILDAPTPAIQSERLIQDPSAKNIPWDPSDFVELKTMESAAANIENSYQREKLVQEIIKKAAAVGYDIEIDPETLRVTKLSRRPAGTNSGSN